MRTVDIVDLESQLSGYLQYVRDGEEIVVRDHSIPVARILPFHQDQHVAREAELVAAGVLKMPEESIDWDDFFRMPAGDVPHDVAVQALIESRGD